MNFPDLHRHLGGATHPRILWGYIERRGDSDEAARLRRVYPDYEAFAHEFTRPFRDLDDYLTVHHLVESLQAEDVAYFALRAARGAAVFESLDYLELRFNPYKRTPKSLPDSERRALMPDITRQIIRAARATGFPIRTEFILCMDRGFTPELNRAILETAAVLPDVVAVDLAGPYQRGGPTMEDWRELFALAKTLGLHTTAHMAESDSSDIHPSLFPHLDRIGHGIQIALHRPDLLPELAVRNIALEICPTTYLRTQTLPNFAALSPVFERCEAAGVSLTIATDNPALHGDTGRIVGEYESLVRAQVIHFDDILRYAAQGYRCAFGQTGR